MSKKPIIVFEGIEGSGKTLHIKNVSNYLKKKVDSYDIQYMYGGGYYKIENLPDPENNQILDVYVLIQDVSKFEDMNYLKDLFVQDEQANTPAKRKKNTGQ